MREKWTDERRALTASKRVFVSAWTRCRRRQLLRVRQQILIMNDQHGPNGARGMSAATNVRVRGFARALGVSLVVFAAFLVSVPLANAGTLTVDIAGSQGATGSIIDGTGADDGTGNAIDCSGPPSTGKCNAPYSNAVQLVLTASPGPGSVFDGWSGLGDDIAIPEDNCRELVNPCMVWLSGSDDRTLTASFVPAESASRFTIDIVGSGGATGTVAGSGGIGQINCTGPPSTGTCSTLFENDSPQGGLTAIPGPNSDFAGWTGLDSGISIPEDNCYALVNPCMVWLYGMDNREFTATFKPTDGGGCAIEPWECPNVGLDQIFTPRAPSVIDAFGAAGSVKRCGKGKFRRKGRCLRARTLARRSCRSHRGGIKRHCVRRVMRKVRRASH